MNQCQGRHATCVFQVEVILANLVGQQQALVHNGTGAHGGAEVFSAVRQVQVLDGVHGALANYIQFAFQCVGHHDVAATADKHLANHGFFQAHCWAHGHVGIHRHITPAQQHLALGFHGTLNFLLAGNARCGFFGQEQHADTVFTGGWQGNALLGHFFTEESIGNLNQDTGTVAHQWVGTHGTTVVQVFQNFQAARNNVMRTLAFDVRHKANATGVVFIAGGVHAFFFGNLSDVLVLHGKAPDFSTWVTLLHCRKILKENKRGLTLINAPHRNQGHLIGDTPNNMHLICAFDCFGRSPTRSGANRSIRKLLNLRAKRIIAPKPPFLQALQKPRSVMLAQTLFTELPVAALALEGRVAQLPVNRQICQPGFIHHPGMGRKTAPGISGQIRGTCRTHGQLLNKQAGFQAVQTGLNHCGFKPGLPQRTGMHCLHLPNSRRKMPVQVLYKTPGLGSLGSADHEQCACRHQAICMNCHVFFGSAWGQLGVKQGKSLAGFKYVLPGDAL